MAADEVSEKSWLARGISWVRRRILLGTLVAIGIAVLTSAVNWAMSSALGYDDLRCFVSETYAEWVASMRGDKALVLVAPLKSDRDRRVTGAIVRAINEIGVAAVELCQEIEDRPDEAEKAAGKLRARNGQVFIWGSLGAPAGRIRLHFVLSGGAVPLSTTFKIFDEDDLDDAFMLFVQRAVLADAPPSSPPVEVPAQAPPPAEPEPGLLPDGDFVASAPAPVEPTPSEPPAPEPVVIGRIVRSEAQFLTAKLEIANQDAVVAGDVVYCLDSSGASIALRLLEPAELGARITAARILADGASCELGSDVVKRLG